MVERGNEKSVGPARNVVTGARNSLFGGSGIAIFMVAVSLRDPAETRGDITGLFRMQPRFASIPLVLYGASFPRGGASAASVERQATSLIDWHVSIATERP